MRYVTLILLSAFVFEMAPIAHGHEGQEHHQPSSGQGKLGSLAQGSPHAIKLPTIDGPKPWSDKPVLSDPDRFQIAIMTDRTGGHRPGIWMDAVNKVNLLRPDFVVSVGDLIEGYTGDRATVERQWDEFLGFVDNMQMRFFFVAGNHDVTNPMMHTIWREHFGPEWYAFDYRGVHFLCLSSEDPQQHLGEEQLTFIERDLREHADARWTLVFLHKPLWTYAERQIQQTGQDQTNWKRVEQMLVDRPHTVFAGHVHHYVQYQRSGAEYYSLATTGGGSSLRGDQYGEFDHITWLTMEKDGPHIANLRLDGILPPDVVTEDSAQRLGDFLRNVRVEVDPVLIDDQSSQFSQGELRVRLVNNLGRQVRLSADIDGLPLAGVTVEPESIEITCGPTGAAEQLVRVSFAEPISLERLRRAVLQATSVVVADDDGPAIEAERAVPIVIDSRFTCPRAADSFAIDGEFDDWQAKSYGMGQNPLVLGAVNDWQGSADGSFEIATQHNDEFLYVRLRVTDERIVPSKDRIAVLLDGRGEIRRLDDPRQRRGTSVLEVAAPRSAKPSQLAVGPAWRRRAVERAQASGRKTDNGYDIELAIPISRLNRAETGSWQSFQLAAVQFDADDANRSPSEIVWRGSADYRGSNANFARFYRP